MKRFFAVLGVALLLGSFLGCHKRADGGKAGGGFKQGKTFTGRLTKDGLYVETRTAMGTIFRLVVAADPRVENRDEVLERVASACAAAFAEVDRLERLMSDHVKGSDVWRMNEASAKALQEGRKTPVSVRVSKEVMVVIQEAVQVSKLTGGAFDVTYAALKGPWHMGPEGPKKVAEPQAVKQALRFVGYKRLELDPENDIVRIQPGTRVDLGGIAKGYAIDAASSILKQAGYPNHIVYGGGDLMVSGRRPGGKPWRIGIQDPGHRGEYFAVLPTVDRAVVTSGSYERFFEKNGVRYHHILDPRTGRPAKGLQSVTVVSDRAVFADGLATGLFVMGLDASRSLVERLDDTDALFVTDDGKVVATSGIKERLDVRYQPGRRKGAGPAGPGNQRPRPRS